MNTRTLLIAAVFASLLFDVVPARADDPPAVANVGVFRSALDPQKKALKLSAALRAIGAAQTAPQTLEVRLTPMAPRAAGGAAITRAGTIAFQGADAAEPDGVYTLMRGAGVIAIASVEMRIPTEAGKLYVVDCRVRAPSGSGTKFTLTRGVTTSIVTVDDGHVFAAFPATATTTTLVLGAMPGPSDTSAVLGYFSGCDVGKAS